jgi:hypothetical protein
VDGGLCLQSEIPLIHAGQPVDAVVWVKHSSAHLQKQFSDKLSAEEHDLLRADMVRERLKNVSRPVVKPPVAAN